MIVVLSSDAGAEDRRRLDEFARSAGAAIRVLDPDCEGGRTLVTIESSRTGPDPDLAARVRLWPGVHDVIVLDERQPLCATAPGRVQVGRGASGTKPVTVGPEHLAWIAGPCSVDDPDALGETARAVAAAGASMLRGGAFKPRTSPYSFQGWGREGLVLLATVARDVGLPLVTEVLDPRDVDIVAQHADLLQIGARSMQNFPLLREAGASGRPVLLKRGMAASLDELLCSAEYVLQAGCRGLILCERGVKGFDGSRRNVLDLAIVPALARRTRLPVIVDPAHATGRREFVIPMAKAAVAAGADGVMVEVHSRPERALSDGAQALLPSDLEELGTALRALARLERREIPAGPCAKPAAARAPAAPGNASRRAEAEEGRLA